MIKYFNFSLRTCTQKIKNMNRFIIEMINDQHLIIISVLFTNMIHYQHMNNITFDIAVILIDRESMRRPFGKISDVEK